MEVPIISAVAGVSTVLGLLALISYFFVSARLRALDRSAQNSVRATIEGQGIFNADQVIDILKTFSTDEARLGALKELAAAQAQSQETAGNVYAAIKRDIRPFEAQQNQLRELRKQVLPVGGMLLVIALVGTAYGLATSADFRELLKGLLPEFSEARRSEKVFLFESDPPLELTSSPLDLRVEACVHANSDDIYLDGESAHVRLSPAVPPSVATAVISKGQGEKTDMVCWVLHVPPNVEFDEEIRFAAFLSLYVHQRDDTTPAVTQLEPRLLNAG